MAWNNHTDAEIKTLCRELGALVRAAAIFGSEKQSGAASQWSVDCVLDQVGKTLRAALRRDPNAGEIEWVWEQPDGDTGL